jgi:hypothetical protein
MESEGHLRKTGKLISKVWDNDRDHFLLLQQEFRRNNEFVSNEIERFEDGELVGLRRDVDDG